MQKQSRGVLQAVSGLIAGANFATAQGPLTPPGPPAPTFKTLPTRQYRIHGAPNLTLPIAWAEVGLGLIPPGAGATTTRNVAPSADPYRFFLMEAVKPLVP